MAATMDQPQQQRQHEQPRQSPLQKSKQRKGLDASKGTTPVPLVSSSSSKRLHGNSRKQSPSVEKSSDASTSTTIGSSSTAQSASSTRIRSRYLRRLGFGVPQVAPLSSRAEPTLTKTGNSSSSSSSSSPVPVRAIKKTKLKDVEDNIKVEVLKSDYGQEDDSIDLHSPPTRSSPLLGRFLVGKGRRTPPKVSFKSTVKVKDIPNYRKNFSERYKTCLWIRPNEFEKIAQRNFIEFTSEGWDYKSAIEEKDFVYNGREWVHPIHAVLESTRLLQEEEAALEDPYYAAPQESVATPSRSSTGSCCSMNNQFMKVLSAQKEQQQHCHQHRQHPNCGYNPHFHHPQHEQEELYYADHRQPTSTIR